MKYFGFFKGMKYGNCEDDFNEYKRIKNTLKTESVLEYMENLPIACVAPMSVEDIFDGEHIEQAGLIEDGEFSYPLDFIHYYKKYSIGIPIEYEKYIESKIN